MKSKFFSASNLWRRGRADAWSHRSILALLRQAGYAEEVKDRGEWQSFRMNTFVNRAQPLMKKGVSYQ